MPSSSISQTVGDALSSDDCLLQGVHLWKLVYFRVYLTRYTGATTLPRRSDSLSESTALRLCIDCVLAET